MSNVRVEMVGLNEFKAQLGRLTGATSGHMLGQAGTAGLLLVQNAAKQKVPKRTRTLSRSIHTEVLEERASYAEVATGTDLEYAAIQEFGGVIMPKKAKMLHWVDRETGEDVFAHSVTIPAQPYLRPAWDENKDAMIEAVKSSLRTKLEQAL